MLHNFFSSSFYPQGKTKQHYTGVKWTRKNISATLQEGNLKKNKL
jgi:hypothetical protein